MLAYTGIMAQILILEPYFTGSHADWLRGYQRYSRHEVVALTMPGHFWQWRMMGGAITLAREFMAADLHPDMIVATDMLDLTTFLALTRTRTAGIPSAFYFHENQLTYPRQKPKKEPGFINFVSALAADHVFFNSPFHMNNFFDALPRLLKNYGDFNELDSIERLRAKSDVLPLGVDLRRFDPFRAACDDPPLIVWNHRWEPDKNPDAFFGALYRLQEDGLDFRVALLGQNFRQEPTEFEAARERLGERVIHYGYAEDFAAYARLLWSAQVVVSTAYHDFFGVSVTEAIACGCFPLLVNRLNYPNLIPEEFHAATLFPKGGLYFALRDYLLHRPPTPPELAEHVAQFDWMYLAPRYDAIFTEMAG